MKLCVGVCVCVSKHKRGTEPLHGIHYSDRSVKLFDYVSVSGILALKMVFVYVCVKQTILVELGIINHVFPYVLS
jgi:hypothetical protein